jgi:hypothetical protein
MQLVLTINIVKYRAALSGSLLGIALGAELLAPLADRFGRRPTLIAMMLVVGVTTSGAALATNPPILTGWRIATGLGLGGSVLITVYDNYAFQDNWNVDPEEFTDIIGRNFKEPEEGLGFDGSAHMWRTMI